MDGEAIGWLLFLAVWFISSVVQQIRKMGKNVPGQGEPPPQERQVQPPPIPREQARPSTPLPPPILNPSQDPIRELMRQLGVEVPTEPVERPVASEHRVTPSEHRQARAELIQSTSESLITSSEHHRTQSEARRTISEHRQDASEVQRTFSEHVRGDAVVIDKVLSKPAMVSRRRGSSFSGVVRRDLRRGRRTLKRALVLKEVLDPPIGLRDPS